MRLRRFLRLKLRNPADIPDLAQEVFLRLLRAPRHEDIKSPEAYLFTVATHVVQQHHQQRMAAPSSLNHLESFSEQLTSTDDPTAKLEVAQKMELLEQKLDAMPPRMAMVLLMHRVAGHTIPEIALELGLAEITIKKHLAKALLRCRDRGQEEVPHD